MLLLLPPLLLLLMTGEDSMKRARDEARLNLGLRELFFTAVLLLLLLWALLLLSDEGD